MNELLNTIVDNQNAILNFLDGTNYSKPIYTKSEVMKMLNVSETAFNTFRREGLIISKIGRNIVVAKDDLMSFVKSNRV